LYDRPTQQRISSGLRRDSRTLLFVLVTITSTSEPATDLGFLLHKHPDRVHERDLSFGVARVCCPEAARGSSCTACTSVYSVCSPSKANPSIRDCEEQ
jgi:hypothetical protein